MTFDWHMLYPLRTVILDNSQVFGGVPCKAQLCNFSKWFFSPRFGVVPIWELWQFCYVRIGPPKFLGDLPHRSTIRLTIRGGGAEGAGDGGGGAVALTFVDLRCKWSRCYRLRDLRAQASLPPQDWDFADEAVPHLETEHSFWQRPPHLVTLPDGSALNRYAVHSHGPRPEGWDEDQALLPVNADVPEDAVYSTVATVAESGWDMSRRWCVAEAALSPDAFSSAEQSSTLCPGCTLKPSPSPSPSPSPTSTSGPSAPCVHNPEVCDTGCEQPLRVIPADLNAFLYRSECVIADLHRRRAARGAAGAAERAEVYEAHARARARAMRRWLWRGQGRTWSDLHLGPQGPADRSSTADPPLAPPDPHPPTVPGPTASPHRYLSDIVPVWAGVPCPEPAAAVLAAIEASGGVRYPGGPPVGLPPGTGQQWDYPNVWAPYVLFLVEALEALGDPRGPQLAEAVARRFVGSVWDGWRQSPSGQLYEKYDCRYSGGVGGHGGEYQVQVGFGWTNAVVLKLLVKYYGAQRS